MPLCIGWVMMGIMLTSLHLAPLGEYPFLGSFQPQANMFFGMFAPDREWLGFTKYQSMNGFAAPASEDLRRIAFPISASDNFIDKHWKRRIEIEKYIRGNYEHSDPRQPAMIKSRRPPAETALARRCFMADHALATRMFDLADEEVAAIAASVRWPWWGCWPGCSRRWRSSARRSGCCRWRPSVACGLRCGGSPSQAPNLVGRKAALVGLLLGVTFLVAAPADDGVYRYFIRREARDFAAKWIEDVRNGDVSPPTK